MDLRSFARFWLYLESTLNIVIFGPLLIIAPENGLKSFLPKNEEINELALHNQRFFATLIVAFAGIALFRALNKRGEVQRMTLEALTSCDVLYLSSFAYFGHSFGTFWTFGVLANLVYGIILMAARVVLLWLPDYKQVKKN